MMCLAMATRPRSITPKPQFDLQRLRDDVAAKGWLPIDLARHAQVADMTAYRALSGTRLTPPTLAKLAAALGYSVRRYMVPTRKRAAA